MTDNFNLIRKLLTFDDKNEFYFVQVIQRKKDHGSKKVSGSNNNSRLIRAYYIYSLEEFDFIKPEVIELCKVYNARAGINLNKRNARTAALLTVKKTIELIIHEEYAHVQRAYNTVCGQISSKDKFWLLDVDGPGRDLNTMVQIIEKECDPKGEKKFVAVIPSKNGAHLITTSFNSKTFSEYYPDVEIHKNNPTNLYIPS